MKINETPCIDIALCVKLADSMNRRRPAVIDTGGFITFY